jgi:hypothetical protein
MAKISANGATKVESIKSLVFLPLENGNREGYTVTHTLCSDGRILRKAGPDGTYNKVAVIKSHVPDPLATFRAYVARYEAARS